MALPDQVSAPFWNHRHPDHSTPIGHHPAGSKMSGVAIIRRPDGIFVAPDAPAYDDDGRLVSIRSKAPHDLKLHPVILALLNLIPFDQRGGPLIIDEKVGRPYAEAVFTCEWRRTGTAAGIPNHVWNMDARVGAMTEADDAGAELDQIRSTAGHAQASTTVRYLKEGMGKLRAIAGLRAAHRKAKNEARTGLREREIRGRA